MIDDEDFSDDIYFISVAQYCCCAQLLCFVAYSYCYTATHLEGVLIPWYLLPLITQKMLTIVSTIVTSHIYQLARKKYACE